MKAFKRGRLWKRPNKIKRYLGKFQASKEGLRDLTNGLRDPRKVYGPKEEILNALARNDKDSHAFEKGLKTK